MKKPVCSSCGKDIEFKNARKCEICGKTICLDCLSYFAVYRRSVYRNYEELVPVCPNCRPKAMLSRKLLKVVDEVLGEEIQESKVRKIENTGNGIG